LSLTMQKICCFQLNLITSTSILNFAIVQANGNKRSF
jgi:hypothetical protein